MAIVPEDAGYPMNWFKNKETVRDTYECAICFEVVKDPVQVRNCGHQFCRYCLDRVLRTDEKKCPSCRENISEETIFMDKAADRAIRKLEVNCPSSGCKWNGNLDSLLKEHTAGCPFFLMNCSNVGCGIQVIRQEFKDHIAHCEHKIVGCEYCKSKYVFKDKDVHLETCTHFPIECINKCSIGKVPRNKMGVHIDTVCGKTIIKCKYSEFGCKQECERHQMKDHLTRNMESHLDLSMMEISRLKRVTLTSQPIMVITDFNRKLSEAKENNRRGDIDGDPFFTSPGGYKLKMLVRLNNTREEYKDHLGVYIIVMKSDYDAILSWPFKKKCTFTLIDQQDNEERKNIVTTVTPKGEDNFKRPKNDKNLGIGPTRFVSHATLQTRKYIKDDTVFITLNIEA